MTYPILAESTRTDDGFWRHKCGELLDGKTVHHPVWFKEFGSACAGPGEVRDEVVPYCKKCGPEPSSSGSPIYVSG